MEGYVVLGGAAIPVFAVDSAYPVQGGAAVCIELLDHADPGRPILGGGAQPIYIVGSGYAEQGGPATPVYPITAGERGVLGGAAIPVYVVLSFSPRDLVGDGVWLTSGAIAGLGDTDPVSLWPDSGGHGYDAVQGDVARQPRYVASAVNGKPAVLFDAPDDSMVTSSVAHGIGTGDFTFAAVVRCADVSLEYRGIAGNGSYAPAFYIHQGAPRVYWGGDLVFDTALASNTWYTFVFVRESGVLSCYVNGVEDTQAPAVATNMADATWIIGNDTDGGVGPFDGDITELLLCTHALTNDERGRLEAYWRAQYGHY